MAKQRSKKSGAKRSPGPYMLFVKANRKKIIKQHPSASFGQIGKLLGSAWHSLSLKEKKVYQRKAGKGRKKGKGRKSSKR